MVYRISFRIAKSALCWLQRTLKKQQFQPLLGLTDLNCFKLTKAREAVAQTSGTSVARSLGMSERTLARKLSDDGLNFNKIFQQLRHDLASNYLGDRNLHVSKIAWLLGFQDVSAFTHTFKRWTGKTPSQMRTTETPH
jgi:AraC-like DNA-binding protein